MLNFEIKKGEQESNPYALANYQICTVFIPSVHYENGVSMEGSFDGMDYGKIYPYPATDETHLHFLINLNYQCIVLDSKAFEGIQYIKFVLDKPAEQDYKFFVYVKSF